MFKKLHSKARQSFVNAAIFLSIRLCFAGTIASLALVPNSSRAQGIVPALTCTNVMTVGFCLDRLDETIQKAIREARDAANSVLAEAARQAANTIAAAREAYKDSLNLSVEAFSKERGKVLADIDTQVSSLVTATDKQLKNATTTLESISLRLPLSKEFPLLVDTLPHFIIPTADAGPLLVRFRVSIPRFDESRSPTLVVNKTAAELDSQGNLALSFLVQRDSLQDPNPGPYGVGVVSSKLSIPWREGWFRRKRTSAYGIGLKVLPQSPGVIQMEYGDHTPLAQYQGHYTDPIAVAAKGIIPAGATKCVETSESDRAKGWRYVSDSARLAGPDKQSGHNFAFVRNEQQSKFDRECFDYIVIDTSVEFRIQWSERRESGSRCKWEDTGCSCRSERSGEQTEPCPVEKLSLGWNETRTFPFPSGTWKVTFWPFGGGVHEFRNTDTSNPFLHVLGRGDNVTLQTYSGEDSF